MRNQLHARLRRIEKMRRPQEDGQFTIEELCRAMWKNDPEYCEQLASMPGQSFMSSFLAIFKREEAESSVRVRA